MSSKPSRQLGALLNRVPAATASGNVVAVAPPSHLSPVPYAAPEPAPIPAAAPQQHSEKEVPLQVLVPHHIRVQLDRMHAETRKSLRQLTLEALRGIGINVSDEDIAGKKGRKKS